MIEDDPWFQEGRQKYETLRDEIITNLAPEDYSIKVAWTRRYNPFYDDVKEMETIKIPLMPWPPGCLSHLDYA